VAEWLEQDPRIGKVTYPGLKSSPYHNLAKMITPKGPGALFTFSVKGGYESCVKLIDNVKLFSHVANLGDTRSLIIHPASTTHRQLSEDAQVKAGAAPDVGARVDRDRGCRDIIADLDQALAKATA
jgi:O-acetylhomoserine (thiol)-lyase